MTELAALNVKINGDASGLNAALQTAEAGLENVGIQAQATARQTAAVSGGMGRVGQVFQRNSFAISNAANQFSDLAVQMSMGVPASRALSQQLPQMTAFMGPLATVIGVASGVLIGLAGNFLAARDNAASLTETLDALNEIQGNVNTASNILRMTTDELAASYGVYAERVRAAAESMVFLAQAEAAQRMSTALAEVNSALDGFTQRSGSAFRSGTMLSTAIGNISEAFGVAREEARLLEGGFRALENATTFEEQENALREIERLMQETGANADALPPPLIAALQQLNQMIIDAGTLEGAFNSAADAARNIPRALYAPQGQGAPMSAQPNVLAAMSGFAAGPGEAEGTGGGGGGGGMSLAQQIEADLESLRQGFMTQEEIQLEAYASQQEILQQALDNRLITQQEYNALMEQAQREHANAMSSIDVYRYGSGVQQAQQFMGDMANALQNGNEKMARIAKVFAAGEALINAWRAYSQVIADPTLPFFAKIPAALSVLSAGIGAVNAIKGVSAGGGGGGGAAGAAAVSGASSGAGAAAGGGGASRNVAIQLMGGDMFSRDQVIQLINSINEAVEDGAIVRLA